MTYDSDDKDGDFKVYTKMGIVEFQPHESGLHYLDLEENVKAGLALITTISEKYEGHTNKLVKGAIKACRLQAIFGYPSKKDFENMVHVYLIAS